MRSLSPEETWAQHVLLQAIPEAMVTQHDDGSRPGMYDLELRYPEGRWAAVEVTRAADAEQMALWRLIHRTERWIVDSLQGGWYVEVLPSARGRRLQKRLPEFLGVLERAGVKAFEPSSYNTPPRVNEEAVALQIVRAQQYGTAYPGSIYPQIALPLWQTAGFVADTADPLVVWLDDWIVDPVRNDNLVKLGNSLADERHLFVAIASFSGVPFAVTDLLWRTDPPLPTKALRLPPEITHVWVMSAWSAGYCMRFSLDGGWSVFDKQMST